MSSIILPHYRTGWYLLFLCLVFICLVVIFHYITTMSNFSSSDAIEGFIDTSPPKIIDICNNRDTTLFNPGQSGYNYIIKMSKPNLNSRNCGSHQVLLEKCQTGAILDVSTDDSNRIMLWLSSIIEKKGMPLGWLIQSVKLAKGAIWLEDGYPHTHAQVIIMNNNWFNSPTTKTLYHEITHVHQRLNMSRWLNLCALLDFERINIADLRGYNKISSLERWNPDTTDMDGEFIHFIWTDRASNNKYIFGVYFNTIVPKSLGDVSYDVYKLNIGYDGYYYLDMSSKQSLSKFRNYIDWSGVRENNYHPFELSAVYMEYYLDNNHLDAIGYKKFKNWMDIEYLANFTR